MKINGDRILLFFYRNVIDHIIIFMIGHTHIDILKIDIESWEFDTITTLLNPYIASGEPLPFGQLQLEIHIWNKSFAEYLTWWETLENAGLRPFWTEVGAR